MDDTNTNQNMPTTPPAQTGGDMGGQMGSMPQSPTVASEPQVSGGETPVSPEPQPMPTAEPQASEPAPAVGGDMPEPQPMPSPGVNQGQQQ